MYSSIAKPTNLNASLSTVQSAVIDLDGVSRFSVQSNYVDDAPAAKTFTSLTAAVGTLDITNDIVLTSVAKGTARNDTTFTLQVVAAAANPTNTVLIAFTGTPAAIICTVTPNDGTNNTATPVTVTSANLVQLITSGVITGKVPTITDLSSLRTLQTAAGGGAADLADTGEGDGKIATFAGGLDTTLNLTDDTITIAAHGYATGTKVALTTAGTLPTGTSATDYWIIKIDANTIKLAASLANAVAGTKVNMTVEGSGTHTLTAATASGNVLKLQKSNDNVNFLDIASQTVTLATSTVVTMWEIVDPTYRYVKILYTPAAGQATLAVIVNQTK
jgi:hypothetical protein